MFAEGNGKNENEITTMSMLVCVSNNAKTMLRAIEEEEVHTIIISSGTRTILVLITI